MGLHLILQLVKDDEGSERKTSALFKSQREKKKTKQFKSFSNTHIKCKVRSATWELYSDCREDETLQALVSYNTAFHWLVNNFLCCFLSSQLTIGDRLGPARVRGRVIVHQIKVDLSHHGVQLSSLLPIAVSWEQLIYDGLSPDQVITDRGEKKSLGRYRNIDLSSQCFLRAQREMRKHRQSHHRVWKHSSCPQTASK